MKNLNLVIASAVLFGVSCGVAFSQTTSAGSSSTSAAGASAGAGAVGIAIGGSGSSGDSVGTTGIAGGDQISAFSPVGLGISGGGSANANASPTIVVGSGNTYEATDLGDAVPTMFIPNLTTSNGTCMGSFSSGVTVSGFGGGFGKTYTSEECNARFNANQLNALGATALAMEVMCALDPIYEADQRMSRPKCVPREEATVDPVAKFMDAAPEEPVDMKWFEQDKTTGAYSVIKADTTDYVLQDDGMLHYVDDGLPTKGGR